MAESIELQIKSDAQQATKAISNLQSKLQGLGSTLNFLNGASISNFASGMSQLATSLRSVSSIDTRTFSKIATNMEKLGNLDTARLVSSASALKSMARQLEYGEKQRLQYLTQNKWFPLLRGLKIAICTIIIGSILNRL